MDANTDYPSDYILPPGKKVVPPAATTDTGPNPAADLIRQKIDHLYSHEPNAKKELAEAEIPGHKRSKHQQFIHELSSSGKSLADIQTAWHNYYLNLPDNEKHEVWQEFYSAHGNNRGFVQAQASNQAATSVQAQSHVSHHHIDKAASVDPRSVTDIKNQLVGHVERRGKMRKKGHFHSLLFGLGMGSIVVLFLMFGFFNEHFIAPFITPSRSVSSTPIIIDPTSTVVSNDPKIIIPKINVEIPVIYNEPSIDEKAVQSALQEGVIHYATTPNPGELGNGAIFGHSSGNIFNKGAYKYAFSLLHDLVPGDTFILQKDGKRYVYKIYDKKVVSPNDVAVLGSNDKPATFTLITCDPPGTSSHRLVVVGEQITPDPGANVASKVNQTTAAKPLTLPSNSESLWHRFTNWLAS